MLEGPPLPPAPATAIPSAGMRALHLIADGEPKVFVDRFALPFTGLSEAELLAARARGELTGSTAAWVVRSRLAEDRLAACRAEGLGQYVILGAGLDSFAVRHADALDGLVVYEVDHPAMQAWKRQRLDVLGLSARAPARYVACDFQRQAFGELLVEAGFDPHAPAFVSWLGVSMYLDSDAVAETLRWFAGLSAGSELVMTYMDRAAAVLREERTRASDGGSAAKAMCRPMTVWEVRRAFKAAGVASFRILAPSELDECYLSDRDDGLRASDIERVVIARTGSVP